MYICLCLFTAQTVTLIPAAASSSLHTFYPNPSFFLNSSTHAPVYIFSGFPTLSCRHFPTTRTRWFKYDRDDLCVNKSQFVPVIFEPPFIILTGRNSSVGIATRYGLDGPGIESRWGRDYPHPSRPVLEAHPAS
jgi:hypothetical protein